MACSDKNQKPWWADVVKFPPLSGSQSQAACETGCTSSVGACCKGQNCTQKSGCQCIPEDGNAAFISAGTPCSPNPCCPTCEPYTYNLSLKQWTGRCCRGTYINDGNGACCPDGRDCCGQIPNTTAESGACCPAARPNCCLGGLCQQWPAAYGPPYDATHPHRTLAALNSCTSPGVFETTFTLPQQPFPLRVLIYTTFANTQSATGGARFKATVTIGGLVVSGSVDLATYHPNDPRSNKDRFLTEYYCKPAGVTSGTIKVEDFFSAYGFCAGSGDIIAYYVGITGLSPCECNPLP